MQNPHFAAVTEQEAIGQLLRGIDDYTGHTFVLFCLKILPYVFMRPPELRLAQWSEFDLEGAVWRTRPSA